MRKVTDDRYPGGVVLKGFESTKSFFYLLLGFAALMLLANLGLPPLWGSEGRWAVIARTMLQSGDLLSPTLGVHYYWDKPLLSYWQILPFAYIHGNVSEFTARLPSVVWAMIMLLLTYDLAKRWFGERTALMSMGILATSYAFVFWGRNAQVEMTNAAMILLCLWYFLKHKSDGKLYMGLRIKHHDGSWFQYERASRLCRPLFLHRAFICNKKGMVMDTRL